MSRTRMTTLPFLLLELSPFVLFETDLTVYFFGNIGHWPKLQTKRSNLYVQRVTKL